MASRRARTRYLPARRSSGATTRKWQGKLTSTRQAYRRRERKAKNRNLATSLLTGLGVGMLNRADVELPWVGEVGSAGIVAVVSYGLGAWAVKGTAGGVLRDIGTTAGAIALHELAEDSELFDFLD